MDRGQNLSNGEIGMRKSEKGRGTENIEVRNKKRKNINLSSFVLLLDPSTCQFPAYSSEYPIPKLLNSQPVTRIPQPGTRTSQPVTRIP